MKRVELRILILSVVLILFLVDEPLRAQNTLIPPSLRRAIIERLDSRLYNSFMMAVIDGKEEEVLIINNESEKLTSNTHFVVSGLNPLFVTMQFADMISIGFDPNTVVNDLLSKEKRIKGKQGKKLLLKHLTNSTSGLSMFEEYDESKNLCRHTSSNIVDLSESTFDFEPGMVYNEMSRDQEFLKKILLKKFGLPCEIYFNDNLFQKKSLSNTIVINGVEIPGEENNFREGCVVSNFEDLVHLTKMQLGQRSKKFYPYLQDLRKYTKETRFNEHLVCPGWVVNQSDRGVFYYQRSEAEKINVFLIFEPKLEKAIIIAANSKIPLDDIAMYVLFNTPINNYPPPNIENIQISTCVGEYTSDGIEVVSIIKRNNSLIAFFNGEESHVLYPYSEGLFRTIFMGVSFRFCFDENKEVDGLYIEGYSPNKYHRLN